METGTENSLPRSDDRIHLNNREVRMFLHKELETLVVAANVAAFVHLEFFLLFSRAQEFLP